MLIDALLSVEVSDKTYWYLWLCVTFGFNTWFFVSGIPKDLNALDSNTEYPKALRILAQYTFVPLFCVYVVIFYLYVGKILITAELPRGWIGYLVSSVSILGLFTVLLLHPYQKLNETKWVKRFTRMVFITLIPLVLLLYIGLWMRISQYGITENRFFLGVLGTWVLLISSYFFLTNSKNIKLIPYSLAILVLITTYGPMSAYSVSLKSQVDRLESFLDSNGILDVNGKVQKIDHKVSFKVSKEISSIVDYMKLNHGVTDLQPYFELDLRKLKYDEDNNYYMYRGSFGRSRSDIDSEKISQSHGYYIYSEVGIKKY